jgi:ferredoxin
MPSVITNLCQRDGSCLVVCPVECIVAGDPSDKYPTYYVDPDTCIDCGACINECTHSAIFPIDEVPDAYKVKDGDMLSMPAGTAGYSEVYEGKNHDGEKVVLKATRIPKAGEVVDLTPAIANNAKFFSAGPGYDAKK